MTYIQEIYQLTEIVSEWVLMLDLAHEEIIQNKAKEKMKKLKRALLTYGTVSRNQTCT